MDFESEKGSFREWFDAHHELLQAAKNSFMPLVTSLISNTSTIAIAKIEGRVKDREECIKKFNRKYRSDLEANNEPYTIKEQITDLIGVRVVCLYEDEIEKVREALCEHLELLDLTDKIAQIEKTESSFGYKGLHLDLKLNKSRSKLPEYAKFKEFRFEVQIRTIIQDSWSVLDHKIKYKKSIPNNLKRRINSLAALFEVADREFREIRDSTLAGIQKEDVPVEEISNESDQIQQQQEGQNFRYASLNAFSFLKIANHFFNNYEFEAHKVDGFTQEIIDLKPNISRGKFNFYMRENIAKVKRYQAAFEESAQGDKLNPYTIIRHCLYLGDRDIFATMLTNTARESFEAWLAENG